MGSRKIKILRKNPTYFPQKRLNIPICQKNSANADQMHPRKEYPGTPRHLTPSGAVLSTWVNHEQCFVRGTPECPNFDYMQIQG